MSQRYTEREGSEEIYIPTDTPTPITRAAREGTTREPEKGSTRSRSRQGETQSQCSLCKTKGPKRANEAKIPTYDPPRERAEIERSGKTAENIQSTRERQRDYCCRNHPGLSRVGNFGKRSISKRKNITDGRR